ncbi:MAG: hypothetical protein ACK5DE_10790 [Bacteroidota bacterium]
MLSKASGTDLDFTWVAQDDSNAIQNAIVDAKGDLIAATGADTPARLAVGTNGQFLKADSTTATGLVWASAPASKIINSITTNSTTTTTVTSGTFVDLISVTITPTATSSKILLFFNALFDITSTADAFCKYRFVNNAGTSIYNQSAGVQRNYFYVPTSMIYEHAPSSTSALTYKVQFAVDAGTTTSVSTDAYGYSMTAMEIAG